MDRFWRRLADELVHQSDVGERAAGHDVVVTATAAVRVEFPRGETASGEVAGRGAGARDAAGRRDVVRGDRVADVE